MKKTILLALFAVAGIVMTGCTSVNTSDAGNINLHPGLYRPLIAYRPIFQVDQMTRVAGEANVHVLFGLFVWGASNFADNASVFGEDNFLARLFPSAKNISGKAAFYDACINAKCDSVIAARYEITTTDYFIYQKVRAKVTGYPAFMRGLDEIKLLYYVLDKNGVPSVLKGDDVYVNAAPAGSSGWF